jgi:hypothetical protein
VVQGLRGQHPRDLRGPQLTDALHAASVGRHLRDVMPNRCRALAFALIAIIAVACTTSVPATPGASVALIPSPSAKVTAPAATLTPTIEPEATCPTEPTDAVPEIDLQTPDGVGAISLESAALASAAPVDASVIPIVSTILGGPGLAASLSVDSAIDDSIVIVSISADFLPYGSASILPVKARFDGATIVFDLPDRNISGQLRADVRWTSRCGPGGAAGTVGLTLVASSVAAGCPTTGSGLLARVKALAKQRITVGTLSVPIGIVGWSGRWIAAAADDEIAQFSGWNRNAVITVDPEALISVREAIDDLALLSVRAATFRRADVDAFLSPDSTGDLPAVSVTTRSVNAKGRVNIPAPAESGRYVVEIQASWQTSCVTLQTYEVVSVTVR